MGSGRTFLPLRGNREWAWRLDRHTRETHRRNPGTLLDRRPIFFLGRVAAGQSCGSGDIAISERAESRIRRPRPGLMRNSGRVCFDDTAGGPRGDGDRGPGTGACVSDLYRMALAAIRNTSAANRGSDVCARRMRRRHVALAGRGNIVALRLAEGRSSGPAVQLPAHARCASGCDRVPKEDLQFGPSPPALRLFQAGAR